jgi:hypothetical protein
MSRDQKRWKEWADNLRQEMMAAKIGEITKTVAEISRETGTDKSASTLQSPKFWNACILGEGSHATLTKAGFELSYVPNGSGKVEAVTFRLNASWQAILQRVLDRVR